MYINGRWVQNWPLRAAVEEAFRPNIPDRRYPLFWLWITLDPSRVDPNAHPTKAEVRLVDERRLAAILYRAVHDALAGLSAVPAFSVPAPFASAPGDDASPQSSVYRPQIPTQGPHHARELKASAPAAVNQLHLLTDATDLTARHPELASLTPLAQWASKYILAQGPQGLYIIDQHAAHERIYFERFRRLGTEVQTSQLLIDAVSETLNPQEWIAFQNHRDDLTRWGFDITELGGTTVAVRAVPRAFRDLTGPWALVHTVLEVLDDPQASWNRTLHPVSWADEPHFAMAACKAAIKANRALSMLEMQSLLETLATVDDPRGCPHGRPTLIQLSLEEVDRRFGRRG
jgi:DNA mismatch repair protein MutL